MQWILTYGGVGSLIGLTIGPIIKKGTFELTGLLAGLTVFIVAFIIDLIRFLNKKDKTPDYDERTIYIIRKYYGYVFNIFIIITFLFLAVLTFMGFNKIAISYIRSEEHTSELQSRGHLVCRLLLEKKNI